MTLERILSAAFSSIDGRRVKQMSEYSRWHAVYQDDRDSDESAVAECPTVDDASDALWHYFERTPDAYAHMVTWRLIDTLTGFTIEGTRTTVGVKQR